MMQAQSSAAQLGNLGDQGAGLRPVFAVVKQHAVFQIVLSEPNDWT